MVVMFAVGRWSLGHVSAVGIVLVFRSKNFIRSTIYASPDMPFKFYANRSKNQVHYQVYQTVFRRILEML
jgi:S-adenosylmethionine:tRNA-ribosyltransferase-isomerase (queuine synthetase)